MKNESNNIYGITYDGIHTDISHSLLGTKQYATKHGYNTISIRYNCGYNAEVIAKRINNEWVSYQLSKD